MKRWAILCVCLVCVLSISVLAKNSTQKKAVKKMTNPVVKMTTSLGDITIELYEKKAPVTVGNFLQYADDEFFNDTIFHRVISGFMAQGGGFVAGLEQKETRAPIENEAANGLKNDRGTLAMARTMDPNSATGQFFINLTDNDFLNFKSADAQGYGYAVFAKVIDGMDVVDAMAAVKTVSVSHYQDVPEEDIVILSVSRIEE